MFGVPPRAWRAASAADGVAGKGGGAALSGVASLSLPDADIVVAPSDGWLASTDEASLTVLRDASSTRSSSSRLAALRTSRNEPSRLPDGFCPVPTLSAMSPSCSPQKQCDATKTLIIGIASRGMPTQNSAMAHLGATHMPCSILTNRAHR